MANKVIWLEFVTAMEVGTTKALAVTGIRMNRGSKTPVDGEKTETYALYNLSSSKSRMPLVQLLMVNGTPLQMQVDTGAVVSFISESTCKRVWPRLRRPALEKSGILLISLGRYALTCSTVASIIAP